MASKVLDLLIKVNDQASKELEKISGSTSGEGGGVKGLGASLSAVAGYATIAALAVDKVTKAVADNLEDYTSYVMGVDALAKAFSLSVEEAEQVMLMAEAFGVSNDALFSSLNKLTRDGFGVGTEALEGLREAYQAIEDPADRAQFLFGVAGEQGQKVLAPMLMMTELDWTAFKDGIEALGAVDDQMVVNAQELALASAEMRQEWHNLKLELINWSAPGITGFLELLQRPLSPDSAAQFLFDLGLSGVNPSDPFAGVGPMAAGGQPAGLGGLSAGQPGGALGGSDELTQMIRDLPSNISDAIERSSTGLGH